MQNTGETSAENTGAPQQTDEELLRAISTGHHPSYKIIVEKYLPKLWRLAMNVLHNEAEAEDVVQETLLTVWKNRADWKADGTASFSTWIYRVTLNRCIDQKRRRKNMVDSEILEEQVMPETTPAADTRIMQQQEGKNLSALLQSLPENQRTAMILFYYDDLTVKEISDRMAVTEQAARSLLKRARKALRDKLESDVENEPQQLQGKSRDLRGGPETVAPGTED
ncbi:MAG: sigma-70 family RNA polymerase sigma factor [Micavibrio sp.]|nr:sigma-70 family RNA polymerase sigma factor [Micavibrio sp.]